MRNSEIVQGVFREAENAEQLHVTQPAISLSESIKFKNMVAHLKIELLVISCIRSSGGILLVMS